MGERAKVTKRNPASAVAVKPAVEAHPARGMVWVGAGLLVVVTCLVYYPVWWGEFVWDDVYWTGNPLLREVSGLWRMWTTPTALQQYFPVTGTSFWLDHHWWGAWTLPYHLENVLLHACSALLFWRLLVRLAAPGAWLAAAIFALHPMMVESAGWITERKNVLSLALFLAALLAYGRGTAFWSGAERPVQARRFYLLALLLFVAALSAKITAFSFPAVVLLLAWWKQGRLRWRENVAPVLPFLGISMAFSVWSGWMERHTVGAVGADWDLSLTERVLVAGRAFWFYVGKLGWPVNLCPMYPRWNLADGGLVAWMWPLAAVLVMVGVWLLRKRLGRGPAVALFFFGGTLFPVLGFLNVYGAIYSFVSDRWVYQSSLGLIALVAAGVALLARRYGKPMLVTGFAMVVLPLLALGTWRQSGIFKDEETLWRTTSERNPQAWAAFDSLGAVLFQKGRVEEAVALYRKALEIRPRYPDAHHHLGNAFYQGGELDKAVTEYEAALEIDPEYAFAHCNLAAILCQKGDLEGGMAHYRKALEVRPDYPDAGNGLANALRMRGRYAEACAQLKKVLENNPGNVYALNTLAWELAACPDAAVRDGTKAVELAQQGVRLTGGQEPVILQTLAAAYAEARMFPNAVAAAQRALALATARREAALAVALQGQIGLLKRNIPLRDVAVGVEAGGGAGAGAGK